MKIIILALILFPVFMVGQTNGLFPLDSGNYWIYNNTPSTRMEVGGNVMINNTLYRYIFFGSSKNDTSFYRIEGSKVLKYSYKTSKEWLLYDFAILKDSVMYSADSEYVYKCYNSTIELFQGRNLRKWTFGYYYPFWFDRSTFEMVVDSMGVVEYGGGIGYNYKLTQASINGKTIVVTKVTNEFENGISPKINIYPNPFNSSTIISYTIPYVGDVIITLYNSLGQIVKQISNRNASVGLTRINFTANDLSSGVYFVQLRYKNKIVSKKLQVLK